MFEHVKAWTKDLGVLKEFIDRESVAAHGVFSKENRVVGCENNSDWHDVTFVTPSRLRGFGAFHKSALRESCTPDSVVELCEKISSVVFEELSLLKDFGAFALSRCASLRERFIFQTGLKKFATCAFTTAPIFLVLLLESHHH